MPYIKQEDRDKYIPIVNEVQATEEILTKGDLEYLVTVLMKKYMSTRDFRYSTLHDVVYAVQHASDEYRRRYLDKREDSAMLENGDI